MFKKKIAVLLPYKDHFTNSNAGSASIWVKDFNKKSQYRNQLVIFGNTPYLNDLIDKKRYKNLYLNKFSVKGKNASYVELFKKCNIKNKFKIIEIHNRPSYVSQILNSTTDSKLVLIFHNNPTTLKGAKAHTEREYLLKNCEKLIFVSNWVKEKFFESFEKKNHIKCEVIYPSISKIEKLPKKEKIISFVGKLNRSKGFHVFGNAIIKILQKHKDWKSIVIGDEPREKYSFKHNRLKYKGWISHAKTLELYNTTSISVIPSFWEEPFGRTAIEAASRGCATIISKRGGLVETVPNAIFLTKVNYKELYDKIDYLISNSKIRKNIQINSYKNVLHELNLNTDRIDTYRSELLFNKNFFISRNKKLKILHISNFGNWLHNRLYFISIAKKLSNGFIRSGHDVLNLSDRDTVRYNRGFPDVKGLKYLNKQIVETVKNYNPDFILLGHSYNIEQSTFENIKSINKNIIISQWFEDHLANTGPDFSTNREKLFRYQNFVKSNFITTHPSCLKFLNNKKNFYYLPIPVDSNIERLNIFENKSSIRDLFFSMSHGVNRGILKTNKKDERTDFIDKLIEKNPNIVFDIYGYKKREPVWSEDFYHAINLSKMGLNLTRGKPIKYATSNRIASLIGNGLLTFIDSKTKLSNFLSDKEAIFYDNINDLSEKLNYFKKNDALRKRYAINGKAKYFRYFDSRIVSDYIISKSFDLDIKKPLIWMK